ncbi:MAG: glycerol-3-phosphate dehydrogenase subunit GlpB [Bacteroidales bacterium]|jgi:glycerol-3-phosphate dehydrogenase subunit B|nr:glycerol-3-phosphate dehydrogenase subunit GlpB [Bacteroidales bacterium]
MANNYDIIIIGGGLAGLACGITAAKKGKKCAVVSAGPPALDFSSGSFDLLNVLPDGAKVDNPLEAARHLPKEHPYSKIGNVEMYVRRTENILELAGLSMQGNANKNHYRISPVGNFCPTWLTAKGLLTSENAESLPFKNALIMAPSGFLDFYPKFIGEALESKGISVEHARFHLANKNHINRLPVSLLIGRGLIRGRKRRNNPVEMRSANIAEVYDKNISKLARIINKQKTKAEVVLLPALVGLEGNAFEELRSRSNKQIYMLATMPPSVPGINIAITLRNAFIKAGGTFIRNQKVTSANFTADTAERKVDSVQSIDENDNISTLTANNFVLATGGIFSGGLRTSLDNVKEVIFDVEVSAEDKREKWFSHKVLDNQPYMNFGVRTDSSFRAIKNGSAVENLYAIGACLDGCNTLEEGSGAGVSLLTGLYVGENL